MDFPTIPRLWKKFVETICQPTTGTKGFMMRNPRSDRDFSSKSLVNMPTIKPGKELRATNQNNETSVAHLAVNR